MKMKKKRKKSAKKIGGGGQVGRGSVWGIRVDVNKELKFFRKLKIYIFRGGVGVGGPVGGDYSQGGRGLDGCV